MDPTSFESTLSRLHDVKLNFNTEAIMKDLSILKDVRLTISISNLQEVMAILSSPELNVEPALNKLSSLELKMGFDDDQIRDSISKLQNMQMNVDVSQLEATINGLSPIDVIVDITSLTEQLDSIRKFTVGVDRSEVEKMADLLSSIRVSLDLTSLESSISKLKVSVDTSQLDRSISEMSAINMGDIGKSLASIEAKVSKFNEGPASTVKVISEDMGSSTAKLQTEVMVRLADAIDRLTSSSEKSGERRIVVELEMDGRQMKTKILKDTSLMS
jgi:hypothetical protein